MRSKIIKSVLSISLIALIIIYSINSYRIAVAGTSPSSKTQTETAVIKSKSEVVYASLSALGKVNAVYIVNHFELEKTGIITDYGNYQSVLNLTQSKPISIQGDTISVEANTENFYYQGNRNVTDLPWSFEIDYTLDGVSVSPQELAGRSGELEIHISVTKNENITADFFENYMLQISLVLDSEKCTDIEAPEATIANAGKDRMLVFTVMPKKGAKYLVTAKVNNFTMKGIELSAMPFAMSLDLLETDDMLEDFNQLPEAIAKLKDGVGKLAEGTTQLSNGASELTNGSSEMKKGLLELKRNSKAITGASSQIREALLQISTSLKGSSTTTIDLSDLAQLPQGLSQMSSGLKEIVTALKELKSGYVTAYSALDGTIQGIPEVAITREQIDKEFPDRNEDQSQLLDQLYSSYMAGQAVKGTYSQVKQAFEAVSPSIDTISANLEGISGSLEGISLQLGSSLSGTNMLEQLGQLSQGISALASNYVKFDQGLKEYMDGVGQMSDGYMQFHSGLSSFGDGVDDLNSGVLELDDGTGKLNAEVSKMPDQIQTEVDKLMSEFEGSDFTPISFVSSKNDKTMLVQFVLKSEGIDLPEEDKSQTSDDITPDLSIWDRFIALFKVNGEEQ